MNTLHANLTLRMDARSIYKLQVYEQVTGAIVFADGHLLLSSLRQDGRAHSGKPQNLFSYRIRVINTR